MSFDWSVIWQHRDALVAATATTILLTVLTMAIAVPCGIVVAVLRLYAWTPVRALATAYVELFRNLPLILVVFWAFYVLPILTGLGLSPLATGLAALALNVTAYNAETFRAGINSIRRGQVGGGDGAGHEPDAGAAPRGRAAGAAPHPAGAGEHLGVAVQGHVAGVGDRGQRARLRRRCRFARRPIRVLEMLTAMAAIYWLLGYPQAKLVDWIQRRFAVTE